MPRRPTGPWLQPGNEIAGRCLSFFPAFRLQPKLTAGGIDGVAFFATEGCDGPVFAQNSQEAFLPLARWARPFEACDGVVGNQVYFGAQAPRMAGEEVRLFFGVVHSGDQDVFEVEALFLTAGVVVTSGEQSR